MLRYFVGFWVCALSAIGRCVRSQISGWRDRALYPLARVSAEEFGAGLGWRDGGAGAELPGRSRTQARSKRRRRVPASTIRSSFLARARRGAGGEGGPRAGAGRWRIFCFGFCWRVPALALLFVFPRAREGGPAAGGFDPAPPARSYRVGRRTTRSKPLAEAIYPACARSEFWLGNFGLAGGALYPLAGGGRWRGESGARCRCDWRGEIGGRLWRQRRERAAELVATDAGARRWGLHLQGKRDRVNQTTLKNRHPRILVAGWGDFFLVFDGGGRRVGAIG